MSVRSGWGSESCLAHFFLSLFSDEAEQSGLDDTSQSVNYAGCGQSRAWGRASVRALEQRGIGCKSGRSRAERVASLFVVSRAEQAGRGPAAISLL